MNRNTLTHAQKHAIAVGWLAAKSAGDTQESYARRRGTTARRVRQFIAEFGISRAPAEAARRIVLDAITQLQRLLFELDGAANRSTTVETPAAEPARRSAFVAEQSVPTTPPQPSEPAAPAGTNSVGISRSMTWDLGDLDE